MIVNHKQMRQLKWLMGVVLIALGLTACSGGGIEGSSSSNTGEPTRTQTASFADAGDDVVTTEDTLVILNGSASRRPQDTIASYSWRQLGNPTVYSVSLNNPNSAAATFQAPSVNQGAVILNFELTVTFTSGDTATDDVQVTVVNGNVSLNLVTISGQVTYDFVAMNAIPGAGLDYRNIIRQPSRAVRVELLDRANNVIHTTTTNEQGEYAAKVPVNTDLRVRVRAELQHQGQGGQQGQQAQQAAWHVKVVDNTRNQALYVMQGALINSGTQNSTRDLHASSGWDSAASEYTQTRAAAPFAIVDQIYRAISATVAVDPNVQFPALTVNWSEHNTTISGHLAAGYIGTSFYQNGQLYILGDSDNDSDEYDTHVLLHEWGHYFEDKLSRSDSIGGSHGPTDHLDMRVALSEGFGNALAGMMTNDPKYRDSHGDDQSSDFVINLERNISSGWFSEGSVQSLLYDLFDATNDDGVHIGWPAIYETFVHADYVNHDALTSIFSYLEQLKALNPSFRASIESLSAQRGIRGVDGFAFTETNDAGNGTHVLPVYTNMTSGLSRTLCSIASYGVKNKLSNRRFVRFKPTVSGSYRILLQATTANTDPDFLAYINGNLFVAAEANGNESRLVNLQANQVYVIETFNFFNTQTGPGSGRGCYNLNIALQ